MKISVITATWNSAATIQDTLDSMYSQDYDNIEYIVVDGASSDDTIHKVKEHPVLVHTLISEKDSGIYDALNKGIQSATGDVIGFLHSDDVYADPTILSCIAKAFQNIEIDAVYGDLEYVKRQDTSKVVRLWKSSECTRGMLERGWMPPHPTFYMKRERYIEMGGFDNSFRIAADYDSILRYFYRGKIETVYIKKVLLKMRMGGESNRDLRNIIRKTKEDKKALVNNGIPYFKAILIKNISKISQFLVK
jgi:glycosyltransferase